MLAPFPVRKGNQHKGNVLKVRLLFAATIAALAAVVAGAGGATAGPAPSWTADCINSVTGQKEGTFEYYGPTNVWPPNHKYIAAYVTLTDQDQPIDTPGDATTVAVAGTHDQMLADGSEMTGTGNTDPATDVVPGSGSGDPTARADFKFRAERSGQKLDSDGKPGRTYTFSVTGTTDNGSSSCESRTFTVVVPHDQRDKKSGTTAATTLKKAKAVRTRRAR